ncbi:EAL domain, c-di-GMP-specific phosphodiesterase class I (or its enzymatically inactive variant) [Pseudobutyrivibrio sp. OR37]|uniref:EAL domain-containing protein n=1 Tax=Pseudobutyrivibrio sp. OR37 TaxID=1798186 RepID=UPI0008EC77AD|nr:EAL domain-containing protein [Pseudobutyrivibrio sp. OR37]SFI21630.1 EAL domain, c-di-GMP-specific phosphodiesterase class I (or its enzymatically inactive variant) [Pseudobutyrivibrio sp. OR37]
MMTFPKRNIIVLLLISLMIASLFNGAVLATDLSDKETIIVGVPSDRCPIFYTDDSSKNIVGIGIDLMSLAAENAGYNVNFKIIEDSSLKDALDNPNYDLVMPFGSSIKSTSGQPSIVSDNLMTTPFTIVTLSNGYIQSLEQIKVGMLQSMAGVADTVHTLYPSMNLVLYETMPDCVNALRKGDVDALLYNSYVWSYVLQKPSYSDLEVQPTTMFLMDFRVGAVDTPKSQELINQINVGISKINDNQRQAIILDYTSRRLYKNDFFDYLYIYGNLIIIFGLLLVFIILHFVSKQYAIKKEQDEQIRQLIEYDALTGTLSLDGFRKKVKTLLRENPTLTYLISYNNIKNFKFINDKMGMNSGNDLLVFWADKTMNYLSEKEAVARMGADHFAVLALVPDDNNLFNQEKTVFEPVKNYYINQGIDYTVQLCSGVYVLTSDDYSDINVDKMLDYAHLAEEKAHNSVSGVGYEIYNTDQWEKAKMVADICGHFSTAVKNNEIQVWYQPQVNYKTGKIVGAEASCRWNHEKLGWISPDIFIPMLEQAGLIYDLDCLIWDKVCQDLHRWNEKGIQHSISINLSRYDIEKNNNIADYFNNLVRNYNIAPSQLRVEITERAYVEDTELLIKTTTALQKYGFIVEMDDFGSGYSSLNMLKEVPVDGIKLDYIFLKDEKNKEKSKIIINYIIKMLLQLKFNFIAEGVETKEQAQFLLNIDCEQMQGYYFYKPMPVTDFELLDFDNINNKTANRAYIT